LIKIICSRTCIAAPPLIAEFRVASSRIYAHLVKTQISLMYYILEQGSIRLIQLSSSFPSSRHVESGRGERDEPEHRIGRSIVSWQLQVRHHADRHLISHATRARTGSLCSLHTFFFVLENRPLLLKQVAEHSSLLFS
jgi:hypothetical protein